MKTFVAASTLALVLGTSGAAYALSCVPCGPIKAPRVQFGAELDRLPANFAMRIGSPYVEGTTPSATLTGPGSPQLDCQPLTDVEGSMQVCRGTGMTSTATYDLAFSEPSVDNQSYTLRITTESDDEAPATPTLIAITERDRGGDSGIGTGPQAGIDVSVGVEEPASGLTLEIGIKNGDDEEKIYSVAGFPEGDNRINAYVGSTFCQCEGYADGDALRRNAIVRVRAVDRAGNRSEWTQAVEPAPDPEGCGCTSTGGTDAGGGLLVFSVLAALGLIRVRARR